MKLPQLLFLLFSFISITTLAQTKKTSNIDVNKDVDLVKVYEQVVLEGYGTTSVYKELANAYYFRNEYLKAKKWFEKLFDSEKFSDEMSKHRYKQTLKALNLEFKNNQYLVINGSH